MKLKPVLILIATVLVMSSLMFSAGTPAGTAITNYATGNYKDANGNSLPTVTSNTVTTIVSQVAGLDINPPLADLTEGGNASVNYPVLITNTGNGQDSYALSASLAYTGSGTATAQIYSDLNGNGIIDGADAIITNTGNMLADGHYYAIVNVTIANGLDGETVTVTLTGTSGFDNSVTDASTFTSTITAASLTSTLTTSPQNPQPGDYITYAVCGSNDGTATAYGVTVVGPIPTNTTYVPGSMRVCYTAGCDYSSATPVTDSGSDADGADYNVTNAGQITVVWGDAAPGAAGCVFYQVQVNANVTVGTMISNTVSFTFADASPVSYTQHLSETGGSAYVAQWYDVTASASYYNNSGDPSDYVTFPLTISNTGNGSDVFDLSYTSTFINWGFYWDYNGNGVIDAGDILLTDTNNDGIIDTGTLAQGQTIHIIAQGQIPAGTSDGSINTTNVTLTSVGYPSEYATVTLTTTVTAPVLSLTKTVSPIGNQPPGTTLTYRVDLLNGGTGAATQVIITDAIPTNTTYVAGSMKLQTTAKTDASDGDGATMNGSSVVFEIPQLGPGGNTYITFQVTIN